MPGRPRGVYKNPLGVPAQEYYKQLRRGNNQMQLAQQAQILAKIKAQGVQQNSPEAFERRASFGNDNARRLAFMSDITGDPMFNY